MYRQNKYWKIKVKRAATSGIKLTKMDAALIKGMLNRGDRQHDIASWFGVNGGRIAEISTRSKFSDVLMQTDRLPPSGPYLTGKETYQAKLALIELREDLNQLFASISGASAIGEIDNIKQKLDEVIDFL